MIIICDFDGTLALGNKSHITLCEPNYLLIERLKRLKSTIDCKIKIVTARGSKNGLTLKEKKKKYERLIVDFCTNYDIPYDEISFNKEYGDLYIDDMTINQYDEFNGLSSYFTNNKLIFTEKTVIKKTSQSLFEKNWYEIAKVNFSVPEVFFCNDETIITERINDFKKPTADDFIDILEKMKRIEVKNYPFYTYKENIKIDDESSDYTIKYIKQIKEHRGSFFHGDLSTTNVLKTEDDTYLIDPNYKNIFGSWKTDAGKAIFSLIAYEKNWNEAEKIVRHFDDKTLWNFAISEGMRVVKNKKEYISIVNNISYGI